jgi:predicted transcriptional regulator YdeE
MQPIIKTVPEFFVAGFTSRTRNQDEINPLTAKISPTWARFFASGITTNQALINSANPAAYGVYSDYESDVNGLYTFTAGVSIDPTQTLPPDLTLTKITGGNYLVFTAKGLMPLVLVQTWTYIWSYFSAHPELKRLYQADFEFYPQPGEVEIFIGIADHDQKTDGLDPK